MTVIQPNSISGVTSITAQGGGINVFRADGTAGDLTINNIVGAAATFTGVLTYEDVANIDAVGVITARSDLSIADKIIHTGDTNTAIRFPAADTITAETGGSERLRIDNDGRLLIGTTTEGHAAGDNLTVADSGNAGITIRSGTTSNGALYFSDGTSGADEYRGGVVYHHDGNYMRFYTNGTERIRFHSGGQVTIGSATEGHADADELTLDGTRTGMTIRSASDNYGNIFFSDATSGTAEYQGAVQYYHADNTLRFKTSATDRLLIDTNGNVNIGSAAPRKRLDITGPDGRSGASPGNSDTALVIDNDGGNGAIMEFLSDNNAYGRIFFTDTDASNRGGIVYEHGNDAFQFLTAGTERVRIKSDGKLGVNTNNPQEMLHVNGTTQSTDYKYTSHPGHAVFTGNNSTTAFTIQAGHSVNSILVVYNGAVLTPTTDYTVSGTTLTMNGFTPPTNAHICVRYLIK